MSLADQIKLDYRFFDGNTTVTYTPAGGAAVNNVPALKQLIRQSDRDVYGLEFNLTNTDVVWHMWRDNGSGGGLGTADPANGDTITHGADVYTILGACEPSLTGKCRVFARPN